MSILEELPITDNEHIVLDWNCENIEDVVKQIFEKEVKPFKYNILEDSWDKLLIHEKSNYKEELQKVYKLSATKNFSLEKFHELIKVERFNGNYDKYGMIYKQDIFYCNTILKDYLTGDNENNESVAEVLGEVKNENKN